MKAWKTIRKSSFLAVCTLAVLLAAALLLQLALPHSALAQGTGDESFDMDGSKIEGIDLFWLTPDSTVDNNGNPVPDAELNNNGAARNDHLYIATGSDAELAMTFQFEVSFSGQYSYAPGDIQITFPAQVWHGRDSSGDAGVVDMTSLIGGMDLSVPEAPSTKGDFNWQLVDGNYVLTNTKTLGATSKAMFQMTLIDLFPHDLVDMSESEPITVQVDVVTSRGNVISRTSDPITAQVDTHAVLNSVKKDSRNELFEDVPDPATLPVQLLENLPAGTAPEDYLYVRWYTYVYHQGNQPFSLSLTDELDAAYLLEDISGAMTPGEKVTDGIFLGYVDPQGKAYPAENGSTVDVWQKKHHATTAAANDHMMYIWSAYPKAAFHVPTAEEDPVAYIMYNTAAWELSEYDAAVNNPGYGKPADARETSAGEDTAQITYTPVRWERPTGRFEVFKYTHASGMKDRNYGNGLNQLINGEDVDVEFVISSVGFGYPWTSHRTNPDDPFYVGDAEVTEEDFGILSWKQVIDDCDVFFDLSEEPLTARDFETAWFEVQIPQRLRYRKAGADEYGYKPNGEALSAKSIKYGAVEAGTYAYFIDDTLPIPDVTIEYQVDGSGVWLPAATATWGETGKNPMTFVNVQEGITTSGRRIFFPENTTDVRHTFVSDVFGGKTVEKSDVAALHWDMRLGVTLKASDENIAIAEKWFTLTDTPSTKMRNDVRMEVYGWVGNQAGGTPPEGVLLEVSDGSFYDYSRATISGASYGVSMSKAVDFDNRSVAQGGDNDVENRRAILHYSAKVMEKSNMTDRLQYDQAVAAGTIPAETGGIWYDLLPEGVVPLLNTLEVRPGDTILSRYIVENYKNSGRTLLVVECDLTPTPVLGDGSVYMDSPTLAFDAVYPWDAIIDHQGEAAVNYIAFESTSSGLRYDTLGTITGQRGDADDPTGGNNITTPEMPEEIAQAMTDLDPNTDENRFVYAKCDVNVDVITSAVSGITKAVKNDLYGIWTQGLDGQEQVTVYEGQNYTYRLRVESTAGTRTSDIIIYDTIENYHIPENDVTKQDDYNNIDEKKNWQGDWQGKGQWRGTLRSVDLSEFVEAQVAPVLYYSTVEDLTFADSDSGDTTQDGRLEIFSKNEYDLTNTAYWQKAELDASGMWQAPAGVTAVALDARKAADGSDFVLEGGTSLTGYLHMVAPDDDSDPEVWNAKGAYAHKTADDGSPLQEVDWEKARDEKNNMYAFNNTRLKCVQTGSGSAGESSNIMIRNDYTRVGILPKVIGVSKAWEDQNNHDNMRPESITLTLVRKLPGESFREVTDANGDPIRLTLDESNSWTGWLEQIDVVNEDGECYIYSFREDEVPGYTYAVTQPDENRYLVTNTHPNEQVTIRGVKQWNDSSNAYNARPESIHLTLLRDGEQLSELTVYPAADGTWNYSFGSLDKYAPGGVPYEYTIKETYVPKYSFNADDLTQPVNDYTPKSDLTVQKKLVNTTPAAAQVPFTFTIQLLAEQTRQEIEAGAEPMPLMDAYRYEIFALEEDGSRTVVSDGTISCSGTFRLKADEEIVIRDLPTDSTYKIVEEPQTGFILSESVNAEGTLYAGGENRAEFTNTYTSRGGLQLYGQKTLNGAALRKNQFRFQIVDKTEGSPTKDQVVGSGYSGMPESRKDAATGQITSTAPISFGQLRYTQADAGKTFVYEVSEVAVELGGYTYDETVYTIEVQVEDNGDGTLTATAMDAATGRDVTQPDGANMPFENTYEAQGSVTLKAWKTFPGGTLEDGSFTFELYRYENGAAAELLGTATNNAAGEVIFPEITFGENDVALGDEPAVYSYLVWETQGSEEGVVYSKQAYVYRITVTDNGDGTLGIEESVKAASRECAGCSGSGEEDGAACALCAGTGIDDSSLTVTDTESMPVFTNRPEDGSLTVTKQVTNDPNPLPDQEFMFTVTFSGQVPADLSYEKPERQAPAAPGGSGAGSGSEGGSGTVAKYHLPDEELQNSEPFAVYDPQTHGITIIRMTKDADGVYRFEDYAVAESDLTPKTQYYDIYTDPDTGLLYHRMTKLETEDLSNSSDSSLYPWRDNYTIRDEATSFTMKGGFKPSAGYQMFYFLRKLTKMDVSMLDTSRITRMYDAFRYLDNLKELDLRMLDTSNVTEMCGMFAYCERLETLLVDFDTTNVTTMDSMFRSCYKLKALDLSSFHTPNVEDFGGMFEDCEEMVTLDISNFDTSNTKDFSGMFTYTDKLQVLDLSHFDTSSATSMNYMFSYGDWYPGRELILGEGFLADSDTFYYIDGTGEYTSTCPFSKITFPTGKSIFVANAKWKAANSSVYTGWWVNTATGERLQDTPGKGIPSVMDAIMREGKGGTWELELAGYQVSFEPGEGGAGYTPDAYSATYSDLTAPHYFYQFGKMVECFTDEAGNVFYPDLNDRITIPADTYAAGDHITLTARWKDYEFPLVNMNNTITFKLRAGESLTINDLPAGIEYHVSEEPLDGWTLLSKTGDTGVIDSAQTDVSVFTNEYKSSRRIAYLEAKKLVNGVPSGADEEYTFTLSQNNTVLQTVTSKANGVVQFAPIELEDRYGYYSYQIREVHGDDPDMVYDSSTEYAYIDMSWNSVTGAYEPKVSYSNNMIPVFENDYMGQLKLTKRVAGTSTSMANSKSFNVEVTFTRPDGQPWRNGYSNYVYSTTGTSYWIDSSGTITLWVSAEQPVTLRDIPQGVTYQAREIGTYTHWTVDSNVYTGTISGDEPAEVVFTNHYTAKGSAQIKAYKSYSGSAPLRDGDFTFELLRGVKDPESGQWSPGEVIATADNKADGSITFGPIEFDTEGLHRFYIREVVDSKHGVSFDRGTYYVDYYASDWGDGTLNVYNYNNYDPSFYNSDTIGYLYVTKKVVNATEVNADASFVFDLYLKNRNGEPYTNSFWSYYIYDVNGSPTYHSARITDGKVTFSLKDGERFSGDFPSTCTYEVVERPLPGFTPDCSPSGQVKENGGYTNLTITNTYAAEGEYVLEANKLVNGEAPEEGQFIFELYGSDDTLITSVANAADGSITFPTLRFTQSDVGEVTYRLVEKNTAQPGIVYDESVHTVTLTVADNGDGTLTVTADDLPAEGILFENTSKDSVDIKATKEWKGDEAHPGTRCDIVLNLYSSTSPGEKTLVGSKTISAEATGDALTVTWEDMPLFREANGEKQLITYTVEEEMQLAEGEPVVYTHLVTGSAEEGFRVINRYTGADVVLTARKELTGRAWKADDLFTFEVYDSENRLAATAQNAANRTVTFPALCFNMDDMVGAVRDEDGNRIKTLTYTIVEKAGDIPGIIYDDAAYTATVTLVQTPEGDLSASVEYEAEDIVFENTYTASGSATLSGTKTLEDRALAADQFSFTLTGENVTETVTNAADGSFAFSPIEYTLADVGEHEYTVSEVNSGLHGYTYDSTVYRIKVTVTDNGDGTLTTATTVNGNAATPIAFTNAYTPDGSVQFSGTKKLEGRALAAEQFSFTLTGEGMTETVTNAADGSFAFSPIEYALTDVGEHEYTVTEVNGGLHGYTYDETVYRIKVTVTDNGEGDLIATYTVNGGADTPIAFTNAYIPDGSVQLGGTKQLNGRTLEAEQFSFTLSGDGITETVTNAADGTFAFSPIEYALADVGEHEYTVTEVNGGADGYTYDETVYTVKVTVRDNGAGDLIATYAVNGAEDTAIAFENTYDADCILTFAGVKTVGGKEPTEDQIFTFRLKAEDGTVLQEVENDKGSIRFAPISYTLADVGKTHRYTIVESSESTEQYRTDPSVYALTVTLTDPGTGTLTADWSLTKDGAEAANIVFDNTPLTHLEISKTVAGRETDMAFSFLVTLTDTDGNPLEGTFPVTGIETASVASGDSLLVKHGETARIGGLPVGACYTVEEAVYTAFDASVNGTAGNKAEGTLPAEGAKAAFTNTEKTTGFSVTKKWEGGSGTISLTIYADGKKMVPQPAVLNNGSEYSCTGLPMYTDEGTAIVYSAKERYVDGYVTIYQNTEPYTHFSSAVYDGGTIINRAVTSFRVRKVWEGLAEGEKAPDITLTLYCNGEKLNKRTPEPDANGWYVFKNLPIRYNGADAEYLVKEEPLPGYAVSYGEAVEGQEAPAYALNGGTIVNRKLPQTGDSAMPGLWLAMVLLSGAAVVVLIRRRYGNR